MLKKDISNLLESTDYSRLTEGLTLKIRGLGTQSGWPTNIVNSLTVEVDDNFNLVVSYPPSLAEQVEDLEYGTPGQIPNSVIRSMMYRAPQDVSQFIEADILGDVFKAVGVLS